MRYDDLIALSDDELAIAAFEKVSTLTEVPAVEIASVQDDL
jgi:hypothetical protein